MGRHALLRGGVAAATSLTLAISLGPLVAGAHADTAATAEVVIPAETSLVPGTSLLSAGPSGFLRYEPGRGHVWTTYTGEDTVVDASATESWGMPEFGAGSDVVARYDEDTRTVTLRDMAAGGTATSVPLPAGHTYRGTLGRTVVTTGWSGENLTWHLLDLDPDAQGDGTVRDRTVTGVPDGITELSTGDSPVGDARGMVVQYRIDGTLRSGWLDAEAGKLVELPYNPTVNMSGRVVLTATHLVSWDGSDTVSVYSRDDLTTAVRTVPLENDDETHLLGMVGDRLLVSRYDSSLGAKDAGLPVWRVDALAPDGATSGTVLARSRLLVAAPTPDGGLLVAGSGPDTADWGVNRVRTDSEGTLGVEKVAAAVLNPVTDPVRNLTLEAGRLTVTEQDRDRGGTYMYSRSADTTGGTLTVGARTSHGVSTDPSPRLVGTGDGRTVVWNEWSSGGDRVPRVVQPTGSLPGTPVDSGHKYVRVWDARGRHAAMATEYTQKAGSETRVVDLDTGATVLTSAQHGNTMWGTTLWVDDGNDSAVPVDVRTGKRGDSVWFGPKCLLEDLQAVGRWLLWSCGGSVDTQGVYDTVSRTRLTLTEGEWKTAKLGDGFVVTDEDGTLEVTDVRDGTPVSHSAGTLGPGKPWDVDPYTGLIAYVDARENTHLVPSGIPASALTQLDSAVAGSVDVKGGTALWSPRWWLSKPAASWKLAIRNKATGTTVRTLSGGTAQGVLRTSWNGRDTAGRLVANGAYTWTLTATPADGQGAALTKSGTLKVTGATPVRRDFATSDGFGELLTLDGSGGLTYRYGTGTGTLTGAKTGSGWPTTVKAVPFGDLSGDRCNDVLVRHSSGTLRAYRPACGSAVTPSTAYTSLGTGWNQYDTLTSPGDISGDGRADLIARQASTGDVYLYKATSTGKLSAKVRIGSRWTGYKKILGAGDLNGDGHGDLLAQDRSNELWRLDGTGKGTFKSRVKVFDNWGASYNAIAGVGDLTGDGKADLLSRDTSGNLWRNNGNGKGSFGGRTKIATGWQNYKGVF